MNPNDPWAIPPLPDQGDVDEDDLHIAVGRALSQWEYFEGWLGLLFGYFINPLEQSEAGARAYGKIVSFSARRDALSAAADVYFQTHLDDGLEAQFRAVLKIADRASKRRNDIAHGAVFPLKLLNSRSSAVGYCLLPSIYNSNRRDITGEPRYAYTSSTINRFGDQFKATLTPALDVLLEIDGKHKAQRAGRLPQSTRRNTRR